jgi:hypothetical protein
MGAFDITGQGECIQRRFVAFFGSNLNQFGIFFDIGLDLVLKRSFKVFFS